MELPQEDKMSIIFRPLLSEIDPDLEPLHREKAAFNFRHEKVNHLALRVDLVRNGRTWDR